LFLMNNKKLFRNNKQSTEKGIACTLKQKGLN
jgi:hypothetical protein